MLYTELPKHFDKFERKVFTQVTALLMEGKTNQKSVRKKLKSNKNMVFPKFYTSNCSSDKAGAGIERLLHSLGSKVKLMRSIGIHIFLYVCEVLTLTAM